MKSNKISSLLALKGKSYGDIARQLGRFRQAICKTKTKGTWKADDLIQIASVTGTTLAFVENDGSIAVSFDVNDLN
jgi:hypothetical protein|nr:MAG TPA: HipB, HipA/DNA Complex, multidrug tolerance, autorepression, promoter.77A [Caudoviricetes sp.]